MKEVGQTGTTNQAKQTWEIVPQKQKQKKTEKETCKEEEVASSGISCTAYTDLNQGLCQYFSEEFNKRNPPKCVTFVDAHLIECVDRPGAGCEGAYDDLRMLTCLCCFSVCCLYCFVSSGLWCLH